MKGQLTISLALALFFCFIVVTVSSAGQQTPGIYIERVNDRSNAIVPGLKAQYKICSDSRQLYKRIYDQGGAGWEAVKGSLPNAYDIRAVTEPEPDWVRKNVGMQTEKEYFFGEKYALYQYRNRYEISDAERCKLIKHEDLVIDLDNGAMRYLVTLKDKRIANVTPGAGNASLALQYESHKVRQMPSALKIQKQNAAALQSISKEERVAKLLSLLFADTSGRRVPGVALSYDKELTGKIKNAAGYEESNYTPVVIPRRDDEHLVAGQPCDIISAKNMRPRLWYWDEMHYYPGALDRPIILKTEVTNNKKNAVGTVEATVFRILFKIDGSVFELEGGLQ